MAMYMPTQFYQKPIGAPSTAPSHLAKKVVMSCQDEHGRAERHSMLPIVMTPSRSGLSFWLTIPQGFKAIVAVHGKHSGVWDAGWHYAPPWVTIPFLVSEAHFVYDTPVKECPTLDNVMVTIDISLVVRLDTDPGEGKKHLGIFNFCDTLGPNQLSPQLNAFQEEAVRDMARNSPYNKIYDLMDVTHDKKLENTRRNLNLHFNKYGVEITEIAVTNVHFNSAKFQDEMAAPAEEQQRDEYLKLQQKFKLKKIECDEIQKRKNQRVKENLEQWEAEWQRRVAALQKQLAEIRAETGKQLAEIRETENADVLHIRSTSALRVAQINKERDVELSKVRSTGQAEADQMEIRAKTKIQKVKADAALEIATNKAKALDHQSGAEQKAANPFKQKREYDLNFKRLRVLKAMANNPKVAIVGKNGDNHIAQLLAGTNAATTIGLK